VVAAPARSWERLAPLIGLASSQSPVTLRPRSLVLNKEGVSKTMGGNLEGRVMVERLLGAPFGNEQQTLDAEPTETL